MAWKETGRTWYARPASSSAQRTRVSRASPLPPSGERSKAVMVIVIWRLLAGERERLSTGGEVLSTQTTNDAPRFRQSFGSKCPFRGQGRRSNGHRLRL